MGKCKFQDKWIEEEQFKSWLQPIKNSNDEGFCNLCKKSIKLATMGINALKSHMKSDSHKSALKGRQQFTMSNFFGVTENSTTTASSSTTTTAAVVTTVCGAATVGKSSDIRSVFGANETLQAEVLWCLNTAVHHHSYSSNEGVSELFQPMFPESNLSLVARTKPATF